MKKSSPSCNLPAALNLKVGIGNNICGLMLWFTAGYYSFLLFIYFFVSLSFPIRLEVSTETLTWCVVFNEQNFPSFLLSFFPSFRPSFLIYRFIFFSFSVDSMWRLQRDDMTVIRHFGSMIWRWRLNRKSFSEEMALKDRPLLAATPQRKSN